MLMAEQRSAEERIQLWYQQYHHVLTMTRNDFLGLTPYARLDPGTYQAKFAEAVAWAGRRADYLKDNPADVVQDRLDASARQAREALRYEPTRAEQDVYEARPSDALEERAHGYDVVLDTSTPEMEPSLEELLQRLDQRLDALTQQADTLTHQHQQKHGMGY
jgi:hypothetical protein